MKIKINKQLILESDQNVPCNGIKEKLGFSCKKDKKGFYIATHRARSKSYNSLDKIQMKDIKFITSTG